MMCDERYREAIKRDKAGYALLGVICGCIVTFAGERLNQGVVGIIFVAFLTQLSSLSIILAFIGIGDTYWNKNSRLLQSCSV